MSEHNMMNIVIITGIDGCGKSTIKKLVEKMSSYKYIVLDRFNDSYVYDDIYGRPSRKDDLLYLEDKLSKIANVTLFYLECPLPVAVKRIRSRGEELSNEEIIRMEKAQELFEDYLKASPLNHQRIDTSLDNAERCAAMIIAEVERYADSRFE